MLIVIDDQSIKQFKQWPWPRSLYARLLQQLEPVNPAMVVFDIDFSSPSFTLQDQLFEKQLAKTSYPVALASVLVGQNPQTQTLIENVPITQFLNNVLLANANAILEPSGTVLYYSAVAQNHRISIGGLLAGINKTDSDPILIDYSIDPLTITRISFKDVVLGNIDVQQLKGKKFLVGATAIELGDKFSVPKYGRLSGVEVHALGYESLIAERQFMEINNDFTLFLAVVLLLISLLVLNKSNVVVIISYHLLMIVLLYTTNLLLHHQFKIVLPVALLYITVAISIFWQLLVIIQQKTTVLFKEINRNNYQSAIITQVIQDSSNAIIITDVKGCIKVANEKAKVLLHINDAAIELGEKIFDYLAQSEASFNKLNELSHADEQTDYRELSFVNIAGEAFYIELLVSKTNFEQSNTLGTGRHSQQIFDITITDITEKIRIISQNRQSEIALIDLKNNDPLTKLANRSSLNYHLKEVLENSPQHNCLLILINLDTLKEINQIYGLVLGDTVICQVALMLNEFTAKKGKVFRFSARVFAVVYKVGSQPSEKEQQACLQAIYMLFTQSINLQDQQLLMSVSLAMVNANPGENSAETLINNAVQTLDYVKLNNNIDYLIYEENFANAIKNKVLLKREILRAIENQEFVMYYQSQHDLRNNNLVGFEALIRWNDPEKGLRFPDEFIPIAEEFGMIDKIGELVIALSCKDAAELSQDITIAINVSASQFIDSDIPSLCAKYLKEYQLSHTRIELEITESMMMHDFEIVSEKLEAIQAMGIKIAMDDFGTGYSSLQYLTKLPFDKLKIDRSFVANITHSAQDRALLNSIIFLGHSANKQVLAEGIEDLESLSILKEIGCELGQGYYFSKPLPLNEMITKFNLKDSIKV